MLLVLGGEALINQTNTDKTKMIKLIQENQNLQNEVRRLKLKVGSLKSKLGKDKNFRHDRVWKEMEAIKRRGLG
jgi:peptidoglycan hydrolase CwlO-like protein